MGNDSYTVQEPTIRRSDRRRTGAPTVADDRVYLSLPGAAYDQLIEVFLQEGEENHGCRREVRLHQRLSGAVLYLRLSHWVEWLARMHSPRFCRCASSIL
jgi:hypothetical protein